MTAMVLESHATDQSHPGSAAGNQTIRRLRTAAFFDSCGQGQSSVYVIDANAMKATHCGTARIWS